MLRVERKKPNIFCVAGVQFKPGITEISEPDATRLMNTRQFKGAIQHGDMVILSYDKQPEVVKEVITQDKPKPKQKRAVSQKSTIMIVNDCTDIEVLEGMLKSQKDTTIQKAIKIRIDALSVAVAGEDTE